MPELGFFVRDAEDMTAFEQYATSSVVDDEIEPTVPVASSDYGVNGALFLAGLVIALLVLM